MRRANHASRAVATSVVGSDSVGRGLAHASGGRSSPSTEPGPLEKLEQEVEELRQALQSEQHEMEIVQSGLEELFMRNACEEYLRKLERRIQVIENKNVSTVQWRIEDIEKVRESCQRGESVRSPEFSAGGLDGFVLHFYPRGITFAEEGYCSLYFHIPADTIVSRTLFAGRKRHGPEEADGVKHVGVPEMCVLSNEIDKATGSIVVGVDDLKVISSSNIVETRTKLQLISE